MTATIPTRSAPSTGSSPPVGNAGDEPFALQVHHVLHPSVDICILTVHGDLDLATVPLLDAAVRKHLTTLPAATQVIVDVGQLRFLSCAGLSWLLNVPDLAQLRGVQLHLSGLANRAIARPLELTELGGLLRAHPASGGLFHVYPSLAHALNAVAR